jgi:hypothetical protein
MFVSYQAIILGDVITSVNPLIIAMITMRGTPIIQTGPIPMLNGPALINGMNGRFICSPFFDSVLLHEYDYLGSDKKLCFCLFSYTLQNCFSITKRQILI